MPDYKEVLASIQRKTEETHEAWTKRLPQIEDNLKFLQLKFEGALSDGAGFGTKQRLSDLIVRSDQFKSFSSQGLRGSGRIEVKSFFEQKALAGDVSADGGVLVRADRVPGILAPGAQRLTIRDLLNVAPTASNAIEYVRESDFTNNAALVNTGGRRETVAKPESSMEFEKATATTETLAHWMPASRQILDDVPALQNYIDNRLRYGLKLKEEQELLNGDGTAGHLDGLMNQASDFDTTLPPAGATQIDILGLAIAQAEDASDFDVDALVLNNMDWHLIRQTKNDLGNYVFVNPQGVVVPMLWGKAVVSTKRMARGSFLVGSFRLGATLWDRMQATVEISRDHSDFFVRNMAAILCEERLALTVQRPQAFVKGTYALA